MRWYYVKIFDGDLILRNFIPCYKKSSGEIGMYDTVSKEFFTNQGTGTFLKGNDVNYDTVNLMENRRRILLNTPHIESISGNMVSFKTDMTSKLKECKIHFTPVQGGEGTPSPDNVRPITGWDGVTVTQAENMFVCNEKTENGITFETIDSNGTIRLYGKKITNDSGISFSVPFSFPTSRTITVKGCPEYTLNGRGFFIWDNTSKNHLGFVKNGTDFTETLSANHEYLLAIEIGIYQSIDITFTPIIIDNTNATSLTIPFPQTIYGGYVDLVKGEVVEEWIKSTFGTGWRSESFQIFSKYISNKKLTIANSPSDIVCDKYETFKTVPITQLSVVPDFNICGRSTFSTIFVRNTNYTNEDEFMDDMSNTEFAYKLATPNTYTLTPQTIKALRGLNNLWSNANGNLEVKFWTHINNKKIETSIYALSSNDNFVISTADDYLIAVNGDFTAEDENTYVVG